MNALAWSFSWRRAKSYQSVNTVVGNPEWNEYWYHMFTGNRTIDNKKLQCLVWYGQNRKRTAKIGSGGIGIFVKKDFARYYHVCIIDNDFEGILRQSFENMERKTVLIVVCCYLPSETWERDHGSYAQNFFDQLLTGIYQTQVEHMIYCGDLNARMSNVKDYVEGIDMIPDRHHLDTVKNKHGKTFIDFLNEAKMCVINGRIGQDVRPCQLKEWQWWITSLAATTRCNMWTVSVSPVQLCNTVPDHSLNIHSVNMWETQPTMKLLLALANDQRDNNLVGFACVT